MTAIVGPIPRADRRRLLDRLDELADLDALMRQAGTLARPAATQPSTRRPAQAAQPRKDHRDRDTQQPR